MIRTAWPPCDVCGQPVGERDGVLGVTLQEWQQEEADRIRTENESPPMATGAAGAEEETPPMRGVEWVWGHARCMPKHSTYTVDTSKFNTIGRVLDLTFDLMDHEWFEETNWRTTIRRLYHVPEA